MSAKGKNIKMLGVSVHPLSHKLEWRGVDSKISPTLRATDYKCPHCLFFIKPTTCRTKK